jgi:uncharacterized membrane protein (UPF0127 family)
MRARIAATIAVAMLAPALVSACGDDEPKARTAEGVPRPVVPLRVGDERLRAEVAETDAERITGLAGRRSLSDDEGMLFPFPAPGRPAFWMKGMLIPIDFVWIARGRVTEVTADVPPPAGGTTDGQLKLYRPRQPVDAVLEVKAGWARRHGAERGDRVAVRN